MTLFVLNAGSARIDLSASGQIKTSNLSRRKMKMFKLIQKYSNGFQCSFDGVLYQALILPGDRADKVDVWTFNPEVGEAGSWDLSAYPRSIPDRVMSHIALQLWIEFDILVAGHEYLSPSETARRRAVRAALEAFGYEDA
jgi:hypothetical protein